MNFLISCGQVKGNNSFKERLSKNVFIDTSNSKLAEVGTPFVIRQLNQDLEKYTPQLKIIAPQEQQILTQTDVSVELKVKDLPVFKDQKLKLGNHLDLILDNEVSQPIYELDQPIILKNLSPGTHSLRVFASRPWGESFKNNGAYAQVTFSVLTETNDNRPDVNLPLLTYNMPTGTYGVEPFLLDFYLTNAPLHAVATSNSQLQDWRIKATVNGDSFLIEDWQPVYLTGFNTGENWIQLELIDEKGNNIENAFNNTVRVINYDPQKTDTISKLFTDKISLAEAQSLVEQKFYGQPSENSKLIEPKVELNQESGIEDTFDSSSIEDISQPISKEVESKNQQKEQQNDTSKVISEHSLEMPSVNSEITKPQQNQANLTEANKQSLLLEQANLSAKSANFKKSIPSSSSKTKISNSITSEKSDIKISETNQRELEKKQPETSPRNPTKSDENITVDETNIDIAETELNITIPPQLESTKSNEAEITPNISSIDLDLEQIEETPNIIIWWKKILIELRQKLESLVKLLPNEVQSLKN